MKAKSQKKFPTSIPVLVIGIVLLLSMTLAAIYMTLGDGQRLFSVSNFNADVDVSFEGVTDMTPYTSEYGVKVSLLSTDPNYIGNLRAAVNYSGFGVGLIRVRVAEEWSTTQNGIRTVMPYNANMAYYFNKYAKESGNDASWYDNRANDHCLYYATPVRSASDGEKEIALFTGFDMDSIDAGAVASGTNIHILVEADVVQVNRYPQYWGLSALPWAGGVSAEETTLS